MRLKRRDLYWVGSALDDLRAFPEEVRLEMGHALHLAQHGEDRREDAMTHSAKARPTRSRGNVFEDLRVEEPAEALAKSELAALITHALRGRRLTQTAAGDLLGIDQPKVSELLRGRLTRFSTERLMGFLVRLGRDVEIVVREARAGRRTQRGRIHVRAARAGRAGRGTDLAEASA